MKNLANKTFFRFLFGFIAIVAASFLLIYVVGYYSGGITATSNVISKDCGDGSGIEC